MRILGRILMLAFALLLLAGVFWASAQYFRTQELIKAEGRLSLYQSSVRSALERYRHLSYVLARDPYVIATRIPNHALSLNRRLADFAARSGLEALYYIGPDGITLSSSNGDKPYSFVGQDYSFRPYFRDALDGRQGRFFGIGTTTGRPGYFIADPVRDSSGRIIGVIAAKIDLSDLQRDWADAGENVLLANADGVVILASDPAWLYRTLAPLPAAQRARIDDSRQFPGQALDALEWQPRSGQRAQINGADWLHLTSAGLPHDWTLHYFAPTDRVTAQAMLVTGFLLFMAGGVLFGLQIQRNRRIRAALRRSEEKESELREMNSRLGVEIDERRSAEARLSRTREELERASRLAALGRLAASVTHELGQPIAAMRNHLAAAEISGAAPVAMTAPISALVDRMEGITRQLKFFARGGGEDMGEVDLCAAMETALDLVRPNLDRAGITPALSRPAHPVPVRGNRLRIEQVMTNLLRNAVDALEEQQDSTPLLDIAVGQDRDAAWFRVADNGHGIGATTLAQLQEPFYTTRESGRGMGLGLAISASIVADHSAQMSAENRSGGGTVFVVRFPLRQES